MTTVQGGHADEQQQRRVGDHAHAKRSTMREFKVRPPCPMKIRRTSRTYLGYQVGAAKHFPTSAKSAQRMADLCA